MILSSPHIPSVSTSQNPDTNTSSNGSNNNSDTNSDRNSNEVATESIKKRPAKPHVKTACVNCKKAHLACDLARPCKRCVSSDKADTCHDIQHKKRGRPKLRGMKPMHCHLPSTFTMIQSSSSKSNCAQHDSNTSDYQKPTMTVFLSMELCCARVSDESFDFLGLYPQEFSHRSLYDFIIPQNCGTVSRIHRSLLDNAVTFSSTHHKTDNNNNNSSDHQRKRPRLLPPTQRTTADMFIALPPYQLVTIANGSLTLKDTITFMTSDKSRYQSLDARFYLGGGNGADLMKPDSLQHLYIVCILIPTESSHPSLAPYSEQRPVLPNNVSLVENSSRPSEPLYTANSTMNLETTSAFPELHVQSMDFGQDQFRLSPLKSEAPPILDFEQDDDHQHLPLKRPLNDTDHTGFMDSTASWNKPCATTSTPSPPLSPTSSFTLALQLSSPSSYRHDSSNSTKLSPSMDIQLPPSSEAAPPTKQPGKDSKPPPVPSTSSSSSSFKTSFSPKHLLPSSTSSYSVQPHHHRQTYQQPHQLYFQTMLSSRLSVEAQALARSTRMLTAPAISTPTYNVAKIRHQRLSQSISSTKFHTILPLSSSSSSSFSTSSSSSSSSSSLSSSPSSAPVCHSSPTIPIPTTTPSSTNPTPLYILPSTTTKMSIFYK